MALRVSVVVPTCRRPEMLRRCLAALVEQDLAPADYEVLVCDDGAEAGRETGRETGRTVESLRAQVAARGGPVLRYLPVAGRHGPAAARNRGWQAAAADTVAFTDDDCVPERGWLAAGLAAFRPDTAAVWGRIVMPLPPCPTDYERDAARLADAGFVTANCLCRREVLAALGGLDENFTAPWREDSDLLFSMLERGHSVRHAPHAVVVHPVRPAPWGISLRQQRKILFDALLYKKHPALYRRNIRPAPPWHYYGISCALVTGIAAVAGDFGAAALALGSVWGLLTGRFFWSRIRHTSRGLRHVAEMAVTSAVIPPLAVFWRLFGAVKYRVVFL